ncbi:penicillin-binding protein [Fibrivirga algicola]|uniref:Transpeptidase family protein n=1 Tax=Fibrivirga algicola TaxID=2950420 RepID=A0ABX0QKG5_9BACT|nr:penicillin-binding protein [Fibrivirga algicola]NID11402.1 transpeptidase family protein [Fibrivirga algicola]
MNIKEEFLIRSRHAFYFLVLLGVAITARLVYMQYFATFKGKYWHDRIEGFQIRQDTIRAKRGDIYARDGSLLATSLPTYEVGIDPRVAKDTYFNSKVDSLGLLLSGMFRDKSAREYTSLVRAARQSNRKYLLLNRRRISFDERQQMLTWPFFRATKKLSARGGGLRAYYERYHPYGQMALRTVGDLNPRNMQGQMGLEASFQPVLAGKNAVGLVEILAGGVKKPVDDGPDMKPEAGLDLHTTLDVNFQDIAETALKKALINYNADKGCVIVMDVQTGEIRALANLTKQEDGYVENFNHALAGRTDPGSTFKLATMMALLEEKAIYPEKMIHTGNHAVRYHGVEVADSKGGASGSITAQQVFEKSSNVGIHLMMQSYFYARPDLYCQYLRKFHLNRPTGIHMKGEAPPVMRNPDMKGWSKTSLTFMSYGYEMQLTPLQMLTFYNAVANDGKWVRPMLVKQIKLAGEVIEETEPYASPNPIAKPETIRLVKRMLEGVVTHGTARNVQNPHYSIAGKTGTAQKIVNGLYQKGRYYTSFIGYFPADKPKYSVLTMVDNPHGENVNLLYAGSVSAPVFKEVADRIYAYDIDIHAPMRVRKNKAARSGAMLASAGYADDLHTIGNELNIDSQPAAEGWVRRSEGGSWQSVPVRKDRVPDVRGLALRDALPLLENRGLRVTAQGRGKVVGQSLEPGQALTTNRDIALTLQGTQSPSAKTTGNQ